MWRGKDFPLYLKAFFDDDFAECGRASPNSTYADASGFSKSANLPEIISHGHILTLGRYVGAVDIEDDGYPFEEKMIRLVTDLKDQFAESTKLETAIKGNLKGLGYGF